MGAATGALSPVRVPQGQQGGLCLGTTGASPPPPAALPHPGPGWIRPHSLPGTPALTAWSRCGTCGERWGQRELCLPAPSTPAPALSCWLQAACVAGPWAESSLGYMHAPGAGGTSVTSSSPAAPAGPSGAASPWRSAVLPGEETALPITAMQPGRQPQPNPIEAPQALPTPSCPAAWTCMCTGAPCCAQQPRPRPCPFVGPALRRGGRLPCSCWRAARQAAPRAPGRC